VQPRETDIRTWKTNRNSDAEENKKIRQMLLLRRYFEVRSTIDYL